jgi:hypothetical protein
MRLSGVFPRVDGAFVYYTGRFATELRTQEEVRAFAERPGRVWLLQGHVLLTSPPAP